MAQQEFQIPSPLQSRVRKERAPRRNIGDHYYEDIGFLNDLRSKVSTNLANQGFKITPLDLDTTRNEIAERAAYQAQVPKPPPRQRRLPERIGVGDESDKEGLYQLVQGLKRDIRLIKDAQSKRGAEDWIVRNGLENHLYVDDRDIDGDSVPDIIVRRRDTSKPYIVKGYTTEQSNYPQRHLYYDTYPLAADRKDHSMRDYIDENAIDEFGDGGYTRTYTQPWQRIAEASTKAGYKFKLPNKKLTNNQVFKYFIMKPLVFAFKKVCKARNYKPNLPPNIMPRIEAYFRDNVIVMPVMKEVYKDKLFQTPKEEWPKLAQRQAVKDGCKLMLQQMIEDRLSPEIGVPLLRSLLDILQKEGAIAFPNEETYNQIGSEMWQWLQQAELWQQSRLPRD
jgi:hypothetical protein